MDINISIKILDDGNLNVEFDDKRESSVVKWKEELSLKDFIQEITYHMCSTNPELIQEFPVGFHVETKKINYEKMEKDYALHYNSNKFRWEPEYNSVFDFMNPQKNKYSKKERENFTLICLLCGHTDTVSELYRIPEGTLKNWIYKTSKKKENYKFDWYETVINSELKDRIKLLSVFLKSKEYLPQLTKLSSGLIDDILKELK